MARTSTTPVTTLDSIATELAVAFDNRQSILVSCRLAYEGMSAPELKDLSDAKRRDALSEATQRALQARHGIADEDYEARAKVPANRPGGIGVSASAIKQRVNAYSHVLDAGLTPDILNVTAAFRLHSITGKGHAEKVQAITDAVKGGTGDFVEMSDAASEDLTANRPKKQKKSDEPGSGAEGPSAPQVMALLDWLTENQATFQGDDRAAIVDRLANLSVAFA